MLGQLLHGAIIALTPPTLIWLLVGTGIGLVVGFLPALGATVGVVLLLPFTYGMDLATSVVFLMALYATGQYGDSITSILLNTPGGPGTVASCWEGYPMARRGEGARALGISTFGSMIGGLAGCVGMVSLAWPLTILAMKIGPPEYFALGVMALTLISIASKGETIKGMIMGCAGLALSFIGNDPVAGFTDRFSFGSVDLAAGIPPLSVFVGMFAIAQIVRMLEEGGKTVQEKMPSLTIRDAFRGFLDVLLHPWTTIRSIGIGIYIGILPALGVTTATITAYLVEKQYSPEKEKFGQGVPSGLVATEVSKGCCVVGDMIPTFMLGIPGSITGAIIMAAFILHGIQPGPQFLLAGSAPYVVFAGIILAQILIVVAGLPLIRTVGYVVKAPNTLLAPALTVLCFIGAFVERNLPIDILYMIVFGVIGYALDKLRYSLISLIIGLIIGPLVETNFHRTLSMGFGSWHLFWSRPLTLAFFLITLLFLAWPYLKDLYFWIRGKSSPKAGSTSASDLSQTSMGEIMLLLVLVAFALVMLVDARGYPRNVALFPKVTCYAMLALISFRAGSLLYRHARIPKARLRWPSLSAGAMSWEWSIGTLVACFLLIYIVGFLGGVAIYLVAVPLLLRYGKKWIVLALAAAVTLGVALFAEALHIVLPSPF